MTRKRRRSPRRPAPTIREFAQIAGTTEAAWPPDRPPIFWSMEPASRSFGMSQCRVWVGRGSSARAAVTAAVTCICATPSLAGDATVFGMPVDICGGRCLASAAWSG